MNELIPIQSVMIGGEAVQAVSARELHTFLEVQTAFKDWIVRRVEEYGFEGDRDFCSFLSESSGGRRAREYAITIDMAKELAMVERNEKGRQVRRYFIECEKRLLAASLSEATVAAMLLPSPLPWEKRFHAGFYRALARITNTRYTGHVNGTPYVFARITSKWVYKSLMPAEVFAELRARRQAGTKLHQWLTDGGKDAVLDRIEAITMLADTSTNLPDFEARCQIAFGTPGQLRIVYPFAA